MVWFTLSLQACTFVYPSLCLECEPLTPPVGYKTTCKARQWGAVCHLSCAPDYEGLGSDVTCYGRWTRASGCKYDGDDDREPNKSAWTGVIALLLVLVAFCSAGTAIILIFQRSRMNEQFIEIKSHDTIHAVAHRVTFSEESAIVVQD